MNTYTIRSHPNATHLNSNSIRFRVRRCLCLLFLSFFSHDFVQLHLPLPLCLFFFPFSFFFGVQQETTLGTSKGPSSCNRNLYLHLHTHTSYIVNLQQNIAYPRHEEDAGCDAGARFKKKCLWWLYRPFSFRTDVTQHHSLAFFYHFSCSFVVFFSSIVWVLPVFHLPRGYFHVCALRLSFSFLVTNRWSIAGQWSI